MRKKRRSQATRRMKRQLFPGCTDAFALGVVLCILGELAKPLRDDRDAISRVELVALERIIGHGPRVAIRGRTGERSLTRWFSQSEPKAPDAIEHRLCVGKRSGIRIELF